MEKRLTPICVYWPKLACDVFVSGSFNGFSYSKIDSAKGSLVLWAQPGRVHYRFLVDGELLINEQEPYEHFGDGLFNYIEVAALPEEVGNIALMSSSELETLDNELFNEKSDKTSASDEEVLEECTHLIPLASQDMPSSKATFLLPYKGLVLMQRRVRRYLTSVRIKRMRTVPRRYSVPVVPKSCKANLPKVITTV